MEHTHIEGVSVRGLPARLEGEEWEEQFWFEGGSDADKRIRLMGLHRSSGHSRHTRPVAGNLCQGIRDLTDVTARAPDLYFVRVFRTMPAHLRGCRIH
jgi:hypothetical protein